MPAIETAGAFNAETTPAGRSPVRNRSRESRKTPGFRRPSGAPFFPPRNSKWGQIRLKTGPVVASAIEQRAVTSLIPYAKNARTHSPAQVSQIVASMGEFGFTNPILLDSARF